MHPLLRSVNGTAGLLLAIVPVWAMFAYLFAAAGRGSAFESAIVAAPVAAVLGLVCLFPYYPTRAIPLGSRPVWIIAALHAVPAMFLCSLVLGATRGALAGLNREIPGINSRFVGVMPVIATVSFTIYMLSTALHYVFDAFERSRKAELLSREAQLTALKAQVNPHFLFNSLNSISALVAIDARRAREMCVRLSDFLRTSLSLGERTSIPFAEELALATTYLSVEQIRFGERLRFVQDVSEACRDCEVPPLVIQPLVENAVKHGVATLVGGGLVSIAATCSGEVVKVVIENEFDPEAPATEKSGFGIANVRRRLQTRFGGKGALEVSVHGNTYRVTLSAPCRKQMAKERA